LERGRACLRRNLARRGFAVPAVVGAGLLLAPAPTVARWLVAATVAGSVGATKPPAAVEALLSTPPGRLLPVMLVAGVMAIGVGLTAWRKPAEPPPAAAPAPPGNSQRDPLPDGAVARLGTERLRAAQSALALSAEGRTVITVNHGTIVREWDAADGRLKAARRLANQWYWDCVLAPDGRFFLGHAGRGTDWEKLAVWDVATGRRVFDRTCSGQVRGAAFPADGSGAFVLLETGDSAAVYRADFHDGGWREVFKLPYHYTNWMELSADGTKILALSGPTTLLCWDVAAGKELWRLPKTGRLFAFSPDSRRVAVNPADGPALELHDAVTGQLIARRPMPPRLPAWGELDMSPSFALRFTPDGTGLLFHDRDRGMVLWDLAAGKERLRLPAGFVSNRRGAFTPDGRSLIALGPAPPRWDLVSITPLPRDQLGPDGPATLQRWDLTTGEPQYPDTAAAGHANAPGRIAYSRDGRRLLSVSTDGTARLWDVATATPLHTWRAHGGAAVLAGEFVPAGDRVVTLGNDSYLRLWDAESGKELRSVAYHDPAVTQDRPDGKHLVIQSDGRTALALSYEAGKYRLIRWDLATGRTITSKLVDRMEPAPDGRTAYRLDTQQTNEVRLTDIETGALAVVLKTNAPPGSYESAMHSHAISSDGRLLAIKGERVDRNRSAGSFVHVWDVANDRPFLVIPVEPLNSITPAFSRDGRLLAFADLDVLRVWDLAAGRELWRRPDAARNVVSLAFAPDGRTLAAGYDDTTILIWNLPAPQRGKPIPEAERAAVWERLATDRASQWRLVDDPDTAITLIRERLRPVAPAAGVVATLLQDLGSADFKTRESAERQLRDLGRAVARDMRLALPTETRPEAKRRLTVLLAALAAEQPRDAQAVAVLERIGTPAARRQLADLAANGGHRRSPEAG
jgi:WD40 repeat protein